VDDEGRLCLHVTAPPVDGAANEAIIALLAAELGVRRSCVAIVSGSTSRHKRVRLAGVSRTALLTRWPSLGLGGSSDRLKGFDGAADGAEARRTKALGSSTP
jgi:hypothetical protein